MNPHLVKLFAIAVKAIKGYFIDYPKQDQYAARDSDSQSANIDKTIGGTPQQVSKGNDQVVAQHTFDLVLKINK